MASPAGTLARHGRRAASPRLTVTSSPTPPSSPCAPSAGESLDLDDDTARLDDVLADLVATTAPSLLELYGVGIDTAAILLVAAGDNADRIRSEAAWAHLCGVAPLHASSGKTTRGTGSTGAATAKPTMPCGASCSPA